MKIKELLLLCGCLALLTFFITDTIRRQKGNQDRIRKEAYDFGEKNLTNKTITKDYR